MATEGTPPDNARVASPIVPGPLAIFTATAIGGIVGARMGPAPLMLAAGATALALLRQKQPHAVGTHASAIQPESAPNPPPTSTFTSQSQQDVGQWLSRQIELDQQTELASPLPQLAAETTEDGYQPPSLMLDEDYVSALLPASLINARFADLTEPVQRPTTTPSPAPITASWQTAPQGIAEQAITDLQALDARHITLPASGGGAAWLLGLEPMPSWTEAPPPPQPVVTAPVFSGGDLPDQIDVPLQPSANEGIHLTPTISADEISPAMFVTHENAEVATPAIEIPPPSLDLNIPEIMVQLAQPGEASFDTPPVPFEWQAPNPTEDALPELITPIIESQVIETPGTAAAQMSTAQMESAAPAAEAEIILRPRTITPHTVTPKAPLSSIPFKNTKFDAADSPADSHSPISPLAPASEPTPPLPRAPIQSPREQQARPTWRSWWRGD